MIGIALILLSLQMIGEATAPLKEARFMPQVAGYLAEDASTALAVGALLAFLLHSSVATVLMVAAFVQQAGLSMEAAVPLVLGGECGRRPGRHLADARNGPEGQASAPWKFRLQNGWRGSGAACGERD
ncbi:hypothetical protein QW131_10680 [Roseibium salinum]|nr:hypothetical protein [Roseibium salinum]